MLGQKGNAAMKKLLKREDLENFGSIITLKGTDECLGDLMYFDDEHGCFCPASGKVPVTREEAKAHNAALDKARLKGLDENCEVGQGGFFYIMGCHPKLEVKTFSGALVSNDVSLSGKRLTFRRKGKVFRGGLRETESAFNFRRVA